MTLRQVGRLAARLVVAVLFVSAFVGGSGCFVDLIGCFILLGIGLLLAVVTLPVVALLVLLEWSLGASSEEGPLVRVYAGRRRTLFVAGTSVNARGANIDRMLDGATHRIYFTRISHSLINYERLGGGALVNAQERALTTPPAKRRAEAANVVVIWAGALKAGRLPPVCAKSGKPADSTLVFWFVTRGRSFWVLGLMAPGRRASGPLPLTKRWREVFIGFRAIVFLAAGIGVVALFALGAFPPPSRLAVALVSFGALMLSAVAYLFYSGLRPKGEVFDNVQRERCVVLSDVHSAFVEAVKASAPSGVAGEPR